MSSAPAIHTACACGSSRPYAECCGAGEAVNAAVEPLFRAGIALHQQGRVPEALTVYTQLLARAPNHPGALYFSGAAQLEAGHAAAALPALKRALALQPERDAGAWFALGLAAHLGGDVACGVDAYRQALALDPQFSEARTNLAVALRELGRLDEAVAVLERDNATPDDPEQMVNLANLRVDEGKLAEAEALYRRALAVRPDDFSILNNLGGLLVQCSREAEALEVLDRAASLRTDSADLYYNRGRALAALDRADEACAAYEQALKVDAGYFKALAAWAIVEEKRNQLERAVQLAQRAVQLAPQHPDNVASHVVIATYHRRRKQPEQALAELEKVDLERGAIPRARRQYLYERGAVLDALKRYDEAFASYRAANEATLAHNPERYRYDAAANADLATRLAGFFSAQRIQALGQLSPPARAGLPQPIFITGFPRSGTTLVEQILGSHPEISAGDELPYLAEIAGHCPAALHTDLPYPECLTEMAREANHAALSAFRDYYLERARADGIPADNKHRFTDKMPLNEWHLGLVRLMFPRSPVIHVVRHPLDACLSSYFIDLTHGNYGSYKLETVAAHYVLSFRLAEQFRKNLGLRFLRIRYEDLVDDFENHVHKLLEFVGVPFDERCLAFHENKRVARTASYAQVNQKLYTSSRYRYRRYRQHIEPMIPILEPVIRELGYEIEGPLE